MKIIQVAFATLAVIGTALAAPSGPSSHKPPKNCHPTHHGGHGPPHNPRLPLVDSAKLRKALHLSQLLAKAQILQDFAYSTVERNRMIGTPGHNKTVKWLYDTIAKYPDYYTVEYQPFDLSLAVSANLTVNNAPLEVFGVSLAPGGSVTGKIVAVANLGCEASDFPDVKGAIILAFRGSCQSAQKVALGATAGAVGAIVYNNVEGNLDGYSLQRISTPEGPYVPTGGISKADGLTLLARLAAGEEIIADLSTTTKVTTTYNVIAENIEGDHDNVLHICGHSDSVAAGPAGSAEAEHEFEFYFSRIAGLNFTSIEFNGRSDYGPFLEAGVATCGAEGIKTVEEQAMFGGEAGVAYDINYHGTYDDIKNVNGEAWIEMSKAIAHMTAKYARSWESIPPRKAKRSSIAKREVTAKSVGKTWGI